MLTPFQGKGHCVICDSAYMSYIMGQISCNKWKINMVCTIKSSCTGADITVTCHSMVVRTHESYVWQHNTLSLCVAAWADNAVVKSLSNFIMLLLLKMYSNKEGWMMMVIERKIRRMLMHLRK